MNGNKWFLLVVIGAALILGAASLALAQDDNAAIFEKYLSRVWNDGEVDLLGLQVSADYLHHDSTLAAPVSGVEAMKAYVRKCRSDLPDIEFTVDRANVEGDRVFASLTATLLDAQVPITASARIADGKLVETWFDVNALAANPDMMAAVGEVEADNLEIANRFVAYIQNRAELVKDSAGYREMHRVLFRLNYVYHDAWSDSVSTGSPGADYEWDRAHLAAFPDAQFTAEAIVAHGALVIVHYSEQGTFTNRLDTMAIQPLDPTGKLVEESGIFVTRIEDGKIVELWWYVDSPVYWADKALILEKGAADAEAQEIYNLNKPK